MHDRDGVRRAAHPADCYADQLIMNGSLRTFEDTLSGFACGGREKSIEGINHCTKMPVR